MCCLLLAGLQDPHGLGQQLPSDGDVIEGATGLPSNCVDDSETDEKKARAFGARRTRSGRFDAPTFP
jgi:hypothetical protein